MNPNQPPADPHTDPHAGQPLAYWGQPLGEADAVVIMVHGRGATADSILGLAQELERHEFTYLAPQAAHNTWYPHSFLTPMEQNEPYLSSALNTLNTVLARAAEAGIPSTQTVLLGFSQGACLVLEFAARRPQRYGGLVGLSGGLIGPEGTPRHYPGSLDGTPVLLGCSDVDPHIPLARVNETADVLTHLNAQVDLQVYPGMGHTVNQDELERITSLLDAVHNTAAP